MQYIKEYSDGRRLRVSHDTYQTDSLGPERRKLVHLVRQKYVTIYHMNGTRYRPASEPNYKYGGRRRAETRGIVHYNGA